MEFLSLKVGCTGSSESTLVKIAHCWKSHVAALLSLSSIRYMLVVSIHRRLKSACASKQSDKSHSIPPEVLGPLATHRAPIKDSDQTAHNMRKLI